VQIILLLRLAFAAASPLTMCMIDTAGMSGSDDTKRRIGDMTPEISLMQMLQHPNIGNLEHYSRQVNMYC